jgi:FkbM family methyltransferase
MESNVYYIFTNVENWQNNININENTDKVIIVSENENLVLEAIQLIPKEIPFTILKKLITLPMEFFYGTSENKINVTKIVLERCLTNGVIFIPSGEFERSYLFGDPVFGVVKSFFINETEYKHYSSLYIKGTSVYQVDDLPNELLKMKTLKDIHKKIKLEGGSMIEEYPEQLMATNYIQPDSKVLEIGANIGRNTLVIASILNDSSDLISLECDPESYSVLLKNIKQNNFQVNAINAALSKKKLVQKNWDTYPLETEIVPEGFKLVNTIDYESIKKLNKKFDTLVLDCEGSFYYILRDFPEILNGIKTIIMENDYWDFSHKIYIDTILFNNGFFIEYSEAGGWGPCQKFFFQVFKRE